MTRISLSNLANALGSSKSKGTQPLEAAELPGQKPVMSQAWTGSAPGRSSTMDLPDPRTLKDVSQRNFVRQLSWMVPYHLISPSQMANLKARYPWLQAGGSTPTPTPTPTPKPPVTPVAPLNPTPPPKPPVAPVAPLNPTPAVTPTPTPTPAVTPASTAAADRAAKVALVRAACPPEALAAFDSLGSKLDEKDISTGKTTLDHLAELATLGTDGTMQANNIQTTHYMSGLVQELANPGMIHQSSRGTCGATTAEYFMAINHPAEFTRLAVDLATKGSATMAGGGQLTRVPDSVARDDTDRTSVDRLFQSAEMNNSEFGQYSNVSDSHYGTGGSGLSQDDVTSLVNHMSAGKDGNFHTTDDNSSSTIQAIANLTAHGTEVPVGLNWANMGAAGHELLVTKVDIAHGTITLRNPWGQDDAGTRAGGPQRQMLDGNGDFVMSLADFQNRLMTASVA